MNIYIKIVLVFFLFSFSAKAEIIKKIEINGNQRVSSETIKIFSEVETNSDLNLNNLNNVIKKIYSTNFFKNVEAKIADNILYITVEENPIIQNLKIEGIKNRRILEVLNEQLYSVVVANVVLVVYCVGSLQSFHVRYGLYTT